MYRSLDSGKIIETARLLACRISERFPGSSLSKVADELQAEARTAAETALWLARPLKWVRSVAALAIFLIVGIAGAALLILNQRVQLFSNVSDFLQGLDAAVNELILLAVAIFFLAGLEGRLKRRRALKAIHVLRSMSHIIDMHQLTKDPTA